MPAKRARRPSPTRSGSSGGWLWTGPGRPRLSVHFARARPRRPPSPRRRRLRARAADDDCPLPTLLGSLAGRYDRSLLNRERDAHRIRPDHGGTWIYWGRVGRARFRAIGWPWSALHHDRADARDSRGRAFCAAMDELVDARRSQRLRLTSSSGECSRGRRHRHGVSRAVELTKSVAVRKSGMGRACSSRRWAHGPWNVSRLWALSPWRRPFWHSPSPSAPPLPRGLSRVNLTSESNDGRRTGLGESLVWAAGDGRSSPPLVICVADWRARRGGDPSGARGPTVTWSWPLAPDVAGNTRRRWRWRTTSQAASETRSGLAHYRCRQNRRRNASSARAPTGLVTPATKSSRPSRSSTSWTWPTRARCGFTTLASRPGIPHGRSGWATDRPIHSRPMPDTRAHLLRVLRHSGSYKVWDAEHNPRWR